MNLVFRSRITHVFPLILNLLLGLALIRCSGMENDDNLPDSVVVSPTHEGEPIIDTEIMETAVSFHKLRAQRGQFDDGTWSDEIDEWMGTKHSMMIELGNYLGTGSFTRKAVEQLLGEPDQIVKEGDPLYTTIESIPTRFPHKNDTTEYLIYNWRGTHDFLFFIVQDDKVIGSDWWYAGE
jgi:hypothetical protein